MYHRFSNQKQFGRTQPASTSYGHCSRKGERHMRTSRVTLFTSAAVLLIAVVAYAGGWAVVTINDFPEYAVAGKPFAGTFSVRQHGLTMLSDLKPIIHASSPGEPEIKVAAKPSAREGEYRFELTLPKPGDWQIAVDSLFINYLVGNRVDESPHQPNAGYVAIPLKVVAPGNAPAAMTAVQRGKWLFNAKGCNACHNKGAVPVMGGIGPDLSRLKLTPEYTRSLLSDPAATLKLKKVEYGQMPNLHLTLQDINALTEYLLAGNTPAKS
jgi:mono/diheme cytochrome c family protein